MSNNWAHDNEGMNLEGSFWGARVWHDGDEGIWYWEAWCDGDDLLDIEVDSGEGEEESKQKAMRKAERFLSKLGIDLNNY